MDASSDPVARARGAAERIRPTLARLEQDRRLPAAAVDALVASGVFKLCVPRVFGGGEATPNALLSVIEELARVDGSVGWCAMIGATSGLMSVYLDEDVAREIYGPADAISCGVFAPLGRAVATDDGFRVTGRWPFASGCEHSQWRMGGVIVAGEPPAVRSVIFRANETTVHDTWDTCGLRGTGSHDISVADVSVPRARTFSIFTDRPRHAGYGLPFFGVLASGVAAVGLGIARAALDGAIELARAKKPAGSTRTLAHRELAQLEVARCETRLRAARVQLHAALGDAVSATAAGEPGAPPALVARAHLRAAACHAASEAAAIATVMYELAGGTSIYAASPLQRHFRDAHVVTQHVMVGSAALTMAGRVLLGIETDLATL